MRHLFRKIVNLTKTSNVRSIIELSQGKGSYEGDGKTTVTFLSKDPYYGLQIKSVQSWGFTLNNGSNVFGPMVIFPRTIVSWNVGCTADITKESLCLLSALEPKLDIVVIGLEDDCNPRLADVIRIRKILQDMNISHEILPVEKAIPVFNFLNSDQRYAAAALIPPKPSHLIPKSTVVTNYNEKNDE